VADDPVPDRPTALAADDEPSQASIEHDAEERLAAGSVPGWGLSWWLHEQGLLAGWPQLSMSARLDRMNHYWRAVSEGCGHRYRRRSGSDRVTRGNPAANRIDRRA
jgi:hypothetical protein